MGNNSNSKQGSRSLGRQQTGGGRQSKEDFPLFRRQEEISNQK